MINPPINDLVKKVGNRYSLVVAVAKRAREIAEEDKDGGKDKTADNSFETRASEKLRGTKPPLKPIQEAIDEIDKDELEIYERDPKEVEVERRQKYNITTTPVEELYPLPDQEEEDLDDFIEEETSDTEDLEFIDDLDDDTDE